MDNDVGLGFGLIAVLIVLYFVPMIVAMMRKHPQTGAITILNILLGWTFLGWAAALVWAFVNSGAAPATAAKAPKRSAPARQ